MLDNIQKGCIWPTGVVQLDHHPSHSEGGLSTHNHIEDRQASRFPTRPGTEILSVQYRLLLGSADAEDLGTADRAGALGCRSTILHGDRLGTLNLTLALALHAVSFHTLFTPSRFR
jgi:hypothetical protein